MSLSHALTVNDYGVIAQLQHIMEVLSKVQEHEANIAFVCSNFENMLIDAGKLQGGLELVEEIADGKYSHFRCKYLAKDLDRTYAVSPGASGGDDILPWEYSLNATYTVLKEFTEQIVVK